MNGRRARGALSWHGDAGLKADVLGQIELHRRAARLDPIVVGERRLILYGWREGMDLHALGYGLGLPPALIATGQYLWQGFPEDAPGVRDHVEGLGRFLRAIPVGRDLAGLMPGFLARWLSEPGWGMQGAAGGRFDTLFEEQALGLLGEPFRAERLAEAQAAEEAELERAWRAEGRRAGWAETAGRRVLEAAQGIQAWEQAPERLGRAMELGLAAGSEEDARRWLLAELAMR